MGNRQTPPKLLKEIFALSVYIFSLTSISWSDFLASNIYAGPIYFFFFDDYLTLALGMFQYFVVGLFLIVATMLIARKPDRPRVGFIVTYGLVTLLIVAVCSIAKDAVVFSFLGPTAGLPEPLDKRTIYITLISGLIAAVSGLYSRFAASRVGNNEDST